MIVYRVTNRVNGKVYIGRTALTASDRWHRHVSAARIGKGSPYLGAAIRKHGIDVFVVEPLYEAKTSNELSKMETFFIILHQSYLRENGYNLTLGGEAGLLGFKHSEETKQKIAAGRQGVDHPMYGRHQSEKTRRAISEHTQGTDNHFFGKQHTLESRRRMGARGEDHVNFGKHLSAVTCQRIRDANSRVYVLQSPLGETVTISNLKAFCKEQGLSAPHMNQVFHGKRNVHKGWTRVTQEVRT